MPKMTNEELEKRTREVLAKEALEPIGWWWLSFCDPDRPEGTQFLGACLVRANGTLGAALVAHALWMQSLAVKS